MIQTNLLFETHLFPIRDSVATFGHQADVGGGRDFDELDAASEDAHCSEHDNDRLIDFSVTDKLQSHPK
jgi:hypothetical protein